MSNTSVTTNSSSPVIPFVMGLIPCGLGILVIWSVVGYLLHATPGWMTIVTGLGLGLCVRRNPFWSVNGQTPLINFLLLGMFCWGLILAGRFAGAVAGVNHQTVWKTFRAATDEDGIGELAWTRRNEANTPGKPLDPQLAEAQLQQDWQQAREQWEQLTEGEKQAIRRNWRIKVDWAADLAWSMIIQQSMTVAYAGANLYWHLAGITAVVFLAIVPFRLFRDEGKGSGSAVS